MINVSIIEDHPDFRKGLMYLLDASDDFNCIDSFISAEDGIANISKNTDILLLDINLPEMSGIEAIPLLKSKYPDIKILMLTIYDDDNTIIEAILAGADGYLLKKSTPDKLLASLKECRGGGSPMTASIAKRVLTLFKKYIPNQQDDYSLTVRELEILNLLVEGMSNASIAKRLFISIQTVRNHIRHIYEKLQVHSKSQAVVKAIREGLV